MNEGGKDMVLVWVKVQNENMYNGFQIRFYLVFALLFLHKSADFLHLTW